LDLHIDGQELVVNIRQMGGRLTGHSWKKVLFGQEVFDFDINVQKGGIELEMRFKISNQIIDNKFRPVPHMTHSHIVFNDFKIQINLHSGDLGPIILNAYIGIFKGIFLKAMEPILNAGTFPVIANSAISKVILDSRGEIKMGLLEMILSMLPTNDIKIPDSVAVSYAGLEGGEPEISNGRISGYFEGFINGMGSDAVSDPRYNKNGDLQLDSNAPFQIEVSS
jgi:hypothetical protein